MKKLLCKIFNIRIKTPEEKQAEDQKGLDFGLFYSVQKGWELENWLKQGANPNRLFLHLTNLKINGHPDCLKVSVLHLVVIIGATDCVIKLLAAGADPNLEDTWGQTPFTEAIAYSYEDKKKNHLWPLLLEAGAHINHQVSYGDHETALHMAVARKNGAAVKFLLQSGARLDIKDGAGQTPLDLANKYKHNDIVDMIKAEQVVRERELEEMLDRCVRLQEDLPVQPLFIRSRRPKSQAIIP